MRIDLTRKNAVVTGSSQGIGLAIATGLAAVGAEVVLTGRGRERLEEAARSLRAEVAGAAVTAVACDLATE